MAQVFDGLSILRFVFVIMVLLTVTVGFVANGIKYVKTILWIAVIVGIIKFAVLPIL